MAKNKGKKELDKEALARVKREMAEPRMSSSVHEQEARENAAIDRAGRK